VQVVFAPDMSSGGALPPALYGQVVTVWSIVQPDNSLSAAVITLRGPIDLALAIAGAGKVHIAMLGDVATDVRP
jgi:regulator of RNase E activity RraA